MLLIHIQYVSIYELLVYMRLNFVATHACSLEVQWRLHPRAHATYLPHAFTPTLSSWEELLHTSDECVFLSLSHATLVGPQIVSSHGYFISLTSPMAGSLGTVFAFLSEHGGLLPTTSPELLIWVASVVLFHLKPFPVHIKGGKTLIFLADTLGFLF